MQELSEEREKRQAALAREVSASGFTAPLYRV